MNIAGTCLPCGTAIIITPCIVPDRIITPGNWPKKPVFAGVLISPRWLAVRYNGFIKRATFHPPPVYNTFNSQDTVTKGDFERVVSFKFPKGQLLPDFAGSSLVRKKRPKVKRPDFAWAEKLRAPQIDPAPDPLVSDFEVSPDGGIWISEDLPEKQPRINKMSIRSGRKIRNKIHAMYRAGIAKTFVTLTLVENASDTVAIRCLQKLFKLWRDQWGKFNFLWVAERQENGRVHFHIVLDRFIDVKKENARWVRLMYNAGIVYRKEWKGKYLPFDPTNRSNQDIAKIINPLDIEKIDSVDKLSSYLAAYVTKKIGETYTCQIWNCSRGVSMLFTEMFLPTAVHEQMINTAPGSKNLYIYTKDYYHKGTKKVKHAAGTVILPVNKSNEFCQWVYIRNFKTANVWLKYLDELNKLVLAGEVGAADIQYYSYREYCKQYQDMKYVNYKEYVKIYHGNHNMDARYFSDIKNRGIDIETQFNQFGSAMKGRGLAGMYFKDPKINYRGRRFYNGVEINQYELNKLNNFLKTNFKYEPVYD